MNDDVQFLPPDFPGGATVIIGHRGASGYRPEHTLASYELAARMGADYLEPDLVPTRDGVLVARHENEISETTDVAGRAEFADRRTTKRVDGEAVTGWFTEDFDLDELRTLRAKERLPHVRQGNTLYDGRFTVPTFEEILQLRARLSFELGREIGVYPETKHPSYFAALGLGLEEPMLAQLDAAGLNRAGAPVVVQSFEVGNLRHLRSLGLAATVCQLMRLHGGPWDQPGREWSALASPAGLAEVAGYADAVGPEKAQVIPRQTDGRLGTPTSFVGDAHAHGLLVHPYTFRAENVFQPADYTRGSEPGAYGRAIDEMLAYMRAGVDGVFTDHPDIAVVARDERAMDRTAA